MSIIKRADLLIEDSSAKAMINDREAKISSMFSKIDKIQLNLSKLGNDYSQIQSIDDQQD